MSNKNIRTKTFLRLVVGTKAKKESTAKLKMEFSKASQLELFAHSNSICFKNVKQLGFDDFKYLVSHYHFHYIIDLREVPYLNFERASRNTFFQFLSERSVEYLSLISLASTKNKKSISELFESGLMDKEGFNKEFSNWIKNGPTLLLISKERDNDTVAKYFSKFLAKSNISFSEMSSDNTCQH